MMVFAPQERSAQHVGTVRHTCANLIRRTQVVGLLVGSVLAAGLVVAAPAQATFPGRNGNIAFICCAGGFPWFNEMSATGAFLPPVPTADGVYPGHVAWSRDGRRVAFSAPASLVNPDSNQALWIENADGSGLHRVGPADRRLSDPAWSPGGGRLVFVQSNGSASTGDIYTMTTSGSDLRRLTWSGGNSSPDWSPDGFQIAYTCSVGGTTQLCEITPFGFGRIVTTAGKGITAVGSGSWAPDSRQLAFSTLGPDGSLQGGKIFRISRWGWSLRLLRSSPFDTDVDLWGPPVWSPDGSSIAFETTGPSGPCFATRTIRSSDGVSLATLQSCADDPNTLDPNGWQPLRGTS